MSILAQVTLYHHDTLMSTLLIVVLCIAVRFKLMILGSSYIKISGVWF